MKKITLIALILTSCGQPTTQIVPPVQDHGTHQIVTQPGGSQVVVVKDHSGVEFFMEMLMFQQLMNMAGGINNVYNYRNQHQFDNDWNDRQNNYRSKTTTVINNYYGSKGTVQSGKSVSEQIKYNESAGFARKGATKSNGFSGFKPNTPIQTNTPKPTYTPSTGFNSKPKPSTPKSGFGSTSARSTGFGG